MQVSDLVKRPGLWLSAGAEEGVVISSRVRLARNVHGLPFPGWARDDERLRLGEALVQALLATPRLAGAALFDMGALDDTDKDVLQERHLISRELRDVGAGSALVMTPDEQMAVMVNEEDHLRLQGIMAGLSLREVWDTVNAIDSDLETAVRFAFSPRLGYLTACPTNVGTGLRASVMMHLSGLRLVNDLDAVIRGLERMGLAVRGLLGEGSEAYGNMFQVSNQSTLGEREDAILDRMLKVIAEVTRHELNARTRLMESRRRYVLDHVGRALGILSHARVLSSNEAVDLLAAVRLGIEMKRVRGLASSQLNEILLLTQPGHLQRIYGRAIEAEERDELRALLVRRRLKGADIVE